MWEEQQQWQFALFTAASLNSKWSHKENVLPFSPKEFIPPSESDAKAAEKAKTAAREMHDAILEIQFAVLDKQLKKGGPTDGATVKPGGTG